MKRFMIIFLVFALLFSMLCFTGCRIGPEECNCHGLASNDVINLPYWLTAIVACSCNIAYCACDDDDDLAYKYRDLKKDEFILEELTILTNSDGVGSNGYITVSTTFKHDIPFTHVIYISYKINVYDGDALAGNAIVTLDPEDFKNSSNKSAITKIINIKIDNYISGNYSLELEYVTGKII